MYRVMFDKNVTARELGITMTYPPGTVLFCANKLYRAEADPQFMFLMRVYPDDSDTYWYNHVSRFVLFQEVDNE